MFFSPTNNLPGSCLQLELSLLKSIFFKRKACIKKKKKTLSDCVRTDSMASSKKTFISWFDKATRQYLDRCNYSTWSSFKLLQRCGFILAKNKPCLTGEKIRYKRKLTLIFSEFVRSTHTSTSRRAHIKFEFQRDFNKTSKHKQETVMIFSNIEKFLHQLETRRENVKALMIPFIK